MTNITTIITPDSHESHESLEYVFTQCPGGKQLGATVKATPHKEQIDMSRIERNAVSLFYGHANKAHCCCCCCC